VRYTIVNLYQTVPKTCNQPMPLTCNQHVPILNLYQQNPTCTQPVYMQPTYVHTMYILQRTYAHDLSILQHAYTFFKLGFSHFMKLQTLCCLCQINLQPVTMSCLYLCLVHISSYTSPNQVHLCLSSNLSYMCVQSCTSVIIITWTRHKTLTDMQPHTIQTTSQPKPSTMYQ
jgi:hypothetical protein